MYTWQASPKLMEQRPVSGLLGSNWTNDGLVRIPYAGATRPGQCQCWPRQSSRHGASRLLQCGSLEVSLKHRRLRGHDLNGAEEPTTSTETGGEAARVLAGQQYTLQ